MCIVQTFTHGSATVKVKPAGKNGVVEVGYFGIFTDSAVDALIGRVVEEGARGRVLLVRMDRAIMAFTKMSEKARARFSKSRTPGCVVCRPDQMPIINSICDDLSASGVLRLVFREHSLALSWADRLAIGLEQEELALKPRGTPLSVERDRFLVGCQTETPANLPYLRRLAGR